MFGFLGFKNIALAIVFVFVATFAWSVVDNYTTLSGKVTELQRENEKLTSRLDWCNRRVLRRDESIEAVGGQCAAKIKQFIKDGPPVRIDPFSGNGGN